MERPSQSSNPSDFRPPQKVQPVSPANNYRDSSTNYYDTPSYDSYRKPSNRPQIDEYSPPHYRSKDFRHQDYPPPNRKRSPPSQRFERYSPRDHSNRPYNRQRPPPRGSHSYNSRGQYRRGGPPRRRRRPSRGGAGRRRELSALEIANSSTLYIGSLPLKWDQSNLEKFFEKHELKFEKLHLARTARNGPSKGYAFATFSSHDVAQAALDKLSGLQIEIEDSNPLYQETVTLRCDWDLDIEQKVKKGYVKDISPPPQRDRYRSSYRSRHQRSLSPDGRRYREDRNYDRDSRYNRRPDYGRRDDRNSPSPSTSRHQPSTSPSPQQSGQLNANTSPSGASEPQTQPRTQDIEPKITPVEPKPLSPSKQAPPPSPPDSSSSS